MFRPMFLDMPDRPETEKPISFKEKAEGKVPFLGKEMLMPVVESPRHIQISFRAGCPTILSLPSQDQ